MTNATEGSESASGAPEAGGTTLGGSEPGSGNSGDWTAGLSEDNRGVVDAKQYGSPDDVVSALRSAESKLGEAIVIPGDDASDEERNAFYQKLGRPETAEGYEFGLPEGVPESFSYSEDLATEFRGIALEANLSADQAKAVHDAFVNQRVTQHKAFIQETKDAINATTQGLVQEFGPTNSDSFTKATALADRAAKQLGIKDELVKHGVLVNTGSAETPEYTAANAAIVIALAKVGSAMFAEGDFIEGRDGQKSNPWNKATFNLTEQARITREDPDRAAALKRAALG